MGAMSLSRRSFWVALRATFRTSCIMATFIRPPTTAGMSSAFLGPLIVSNFSVALANRGLQPVNEGGDLVAVLTYEQVDFGRMREKDAFDEPLGMDAERRFIARIAIDVRDAGTGESVFKGHVQRLHDISAGEWMHTGLASQAIFQSFNEVLSEF